MLTKTSLIVFIILEGQLGYIVMRDSEKIEIFFFWSQKVKKRIKILFAPTGTCKKWVSK